MKHISALYKRINPHIFFFAMLFLALTFCLKRTTPYVTTDPYYETDDRWIAANGISQKVSFTGKKLYGFTLKLKYPEKMSDQYTTVCSIVSEDGTEVCSYHVPNAENSVFTYYEGEEIAEFILDAPTTIDPSKEYSVTINTDALTAEESYSLEKVNIIYGGGGYLV